MAEEPETPLDLTERRTTRGARPGDRYVRIVRPNRGEFTRRGPSHVVAEEAVLAPRTPFGRAADLGRRVLFGSRIPTAHEIHERVGVFKGLAVFASDNISSSAYATEEIMRVLVLAGVGMLTLTIPITLVIVLVLAIVVASYQQTIRAYPNGGGSYIVASDNLGPAAGLTAAGALLTDYVLTVSVSIAAGVAALTSIAPMLFEHRVVLGVGFVILLCIGNLRGLRESATLFSIPTYAYFVAIFGLLGYGMFLLVSNGLPAYQAPADWRPVAAEPIGILLILRAFASGSVALTGVEAVSNGVPAFSQPEPRNAQRVLILMGTSFGVIFLGLSVLAGQLGILPDPSEQETVISQLTAVLVGAGTPYHYFVQISTALLLILAANTAFADFPRLSSILAKDGFMPRQFAYRGDRLAFSIGIVALSLLAGILIVGFEGSVTNLIPLYTVGVFVAFTLSQTGMVRHWWKLRVTERGWQIRALFNGVGAVATAIVAIVVCVAKFALGAWMVLILIPMLIAVMWAISRHYRTVRDALTLERPDTPIPTIMPRVVVPVSRLDRATLNALGFAKSIAKDKDVIAVHVADGPDDAAEMQQRWERWDGGVPLAIVESPYRVLVAPLVAYIDALGRQDPTRTIVVVLPEFVPRHFWEGLLHNQSALRLKLRLFSRRNTIVVDVPYHIDQAYEPDPDQGAAVKRR